MCDDSVERSVNIGGEEAMKPLKAKLGVQTTKCFTGWHLLWCKSTSSPKNSGPLPALATAVKT